MPEEGTPMTTPSRDHALVLGAGMAGLLAARVLAEAYDRVTIADRDQLPDHPAQRRGVPQGRHAHALLARGREALEELFPGLTADLVAHGAPSGDVLGDARLHFGGHPLRRTHTGLTVISVSRPFLEQHVRERVRALPGVTFGPPSDIVGLAAAPDAHRIVGAKILRRADGSAEETIDADLVVDATGRGSRTALWLAALGYERPPEDRVSIDLGYTSRRYRLGPDTFGGDLGTLHGPTPTCPRGGVLARLEGGEWLLTLFGLNGDHPPTQPDGFVEFARSMPFADIYQAIRNAEPVDDPVAYRFPTSRRRRYERLTRFPEGLIVLGDGVCSFNPVYGQGITVAAIEALIVRDHMKRRRPPRTGHLRACLAAVIRTPWNMAVAGDLAIPGVQGQRTLAVRAANSYLSRVLAAAADDTTVGNAFVRVSGLVDPPIALLRPGVALRVLRHRPAAPAPDLLGQRLHGTRQEHSR
jgi:2-polyprenyl-6-methoxyphenol hydroxylase-like FAD-dependent oxidoreductase